MLQRNVLWLRYVPVLATSVICVFAPSTARADTITFTETATASGSLGGSSFTNAPVTLTVVGNPLNPVPCTGVANCTVIGGTVSLDVSGIGTATFQSFNNNPAAQGVVDNSNGTGGGGMSIFRLPNGNNGSIILFTDSSVFKTYNITTSTTAPIMGTASINSGFIYPTTAGSFVLNSVSGNSTFTALSTLTHAGGTISNPVTFSEQGLGRISSTIGGLGSRP